MRKILTLICALAAVHAWSQQLQHPVDFDEGFFKKTPFARWMRDPFKNPPGFSKTPGGKSSWPKLESITRNQKATFATLDGTRYKEGQFLDENRYISLIGQNYVIITEGNFDYELVIADPKRDLASDSEEKN